MTAGGRVQIELRGLKRRASVRGACLVLAGAKLAELRRASALAAALGESCLLVAVDGGLRTCVRGKRRPDLFVGDADSSRRPTTGIESVIYPRDKGAMPFLNAVGNWLFAAWFTWFLGQRTSDVLCGL